MFSNVEFFGLIQQVLETLDWLTKYFSGQRAELGGHVTGGLYTMWRPYIKQLSFVLGFMCQQIVVRRAAVVYANRGQGLDAGEAPICNYPLSQ